MSISISHWGMFEVEPRVFVVPAGFKLSEQDRAELFKSGGVIRLERIK